MIIAIALLNIGTIFQWDHKASPYKFKGLTSFKPTNVGTTRNIPGKYIGQYQGHAVD